MADLRLDAVVLPGDRAELVRYPADDIWLRAVGHGDAEFRIGAGEWTRGGSGTVQLLPRGVPHAIRIPAGSARLIQVSIGAPYDGFAREMARLFTAGAPLQEIAAVANRHGVRLG